MPSYDGNGLCGIDTSRPLSSEQERSIREYFILLQQALLAWGTNTPADARGEHSCLGGHLSRLCEDVGAVNNYQVTIDMPSIESANQGLYEGFWLFIKIANTNTGASTLTITPAGESAHPAKAIQHKGAALTGGEIGAGETYLLVYDGASFQLVSTNLHSGAQIQRVRSVLTGPLSCPTNLPDDNTIALFVDSDVDALCAARRVSEGDNAGVLSLAYEVAAGSTTARTYKIRAGSSNPTLTVNGRVGSSWLGGIMSSELIVEELS